MSLINRINNFKAKSVGSLKDYQTSYKYKNERAKQRFQNKYENKQRFIDEVNQDAQLINAELNAEIDKAKNENKKKIAKKFTSLNTVVIVIFSILSACLSCYGATTTVSGIGLKFCIFVFTVAIILGNNIAIQPKLISSLKFNKSLENIIGTSLLGMASLGIFIVSIKTNKISLDKLNIRDAFLPWAFTFGFDVAILGLNFLQYSSAVFDVKPKVKQDLNITNNNSSDITNNSSDITNDNISDITKYKQAKQYVNELIKNTKDGEQIKYNKNEMNFCSSYFYKLLNEHKEVEKKGKKYFKVGKVV